MPPGRKPAADPRQHTGQHTGQAPPPETSQEIELKFRLAPARLRDLLRRIADTPPEPRPRWQPADGLTALTLISRYYDTPARHFRQAGVALRLRRQADRWQQQLKWQNDTAADPQLAGGSVRVEQAWPLPNDVPELDAIEAALAGRLALPADWRTSLAPVFETDLTRHAGVIHTKNGAQVEIAFDLGVLRAGAAEWPLAEIELELKQGEPAVLFGLTEALVADTGARLSAGSKAAEGYRLADGLIPVAQKSTAADITPTESGRMVLCAQLRRTLGDLMANHELVLHDGLPEAVHQMRVTLRRLHAMFRPLYGVLEGDEARRLNEELRWLRGTLAELRNWDVFTGETLARLHPNPAHDDLPSANTTTAASRNDDLFARLDAAARQQHEIVRRQVQDALHSPRYARLLVAMAGAAETDRLWHNLPAIQQQRLAQPFRGLSARWLIEEIHAQRRHGERLHQLPPARQHKFRLKMKNLRYIAELMLMIEPSKTLNKLAKRLAAFQDRLGAQNDLFTAIALLNQLKAGLGSGTADAIDQQIAQWRQAMHADDPALGQRWQQVEQATDAWIGKPTDR